MDDWICETPGCGYTTPDAAKALEHVRDSIPTGDYHTMSRDGAETTATIGVTEGEE